MYRLFSQDKMAQGLRLRQMRQSQILSVKRQAQDFSVRPMPAPGISEGGDYSSPDTHSTDQVVLGGISDGA